jgi:hypothetical protein
MVTSKLDMSPTERVVYEIHKHRLKERIDTDVKLWVDKQLRQYNQLIERVTGDDAYHDFLLTYIKREQIKYQADALDRPNPYDERRERPLCTCTHECPIQSANQPVEFRQHDDLDVAIRKYKQNHTGHPIVLDDAREAWSEKVGDALFLLRSLLNALTNNQIPDVDEDEDLIEQLREREIDTSIDEDDGEEDTEDGSGSVDDQIDAVAAESDD